VLHYYRTKELTSSGGFLQPSGKIQTYFFCNRRGIKYGRWTAFPGIGLVSIPACIAPGTVITEKSLWTHVYSANGRQDRRSEVPGIVAPLLASRRPEAPTFAFAFESSSRDVLRSSALRYLMRRTLRTLNGKHYEHRDAYNVFLSCPLSYPSQSFQR